MDVFSANLSQEVEHISTDANYLWQICDVKIRIALVGSINRALPIGIFCNNISMNVIIMKVPEGLVQRAPPRGQLKPRCFPWPSRRSPMMKRRRKILEGGAFRNGQTETRQDWITTWSTRMKILM